MSYHRATSLPKVVTRRLHLARKKQTTNVTDQYPTAVSSGRTTNLSATGGYGADMLSLPQHPNYWADILERTADIY